MANSQAAAKFGVIQPSDCHGAASAAIARATHGRCCALKSSASSTTAVSDAHARPDPARHLASVAVDGDTVGAIGPGLLALVGDRARRRRAQVARMTERLLGYRVFADDQGA